MSTWFFSSEIYVSTTCVYLQIDKFNIGHHSSVDMSQFSSYSCVSDCPDVEKLLHAHLLPIITPAPGNMLVSGDCDAHKRDPMLAIAMETISDPKQNTKVHTMQNIQLSQSWKGNHFVCNMNASSWSMSFC